MNEIQKMIDSLEFELKGRGISVRRLVREAGINPSTWTRWKSGLNSPTLSTWNEVQEAKNRLTKRGNNERAKNP